MTVTLFIYRCPKCGTRSCVYGKKPAKIPCVDCGEPMEVKKWRKQ